MENTHPQVAELKEFEDKIIDLPKDLEFKEFAGAKSGIQAAM